MRFAIVVIEPAYGMQQAGGAFQFTQALITKGHELSSASFYQGGVYNANQLTSPVSDEFDFVRSWQQLDVRHGMALNIYVAAALHRGVVDEAEAGRLGLASPNLQTGFTLSGLGTLAETSLICDRVVQF